MERRKCMEALEAPPWLLPRLPFLGPRRRTSAAASVIRELAAGWRGFTLVGGQTGEVGPYLSESQKYGCKQIPLHRIPKAPKHISSDAGWIYLIKHEAKNAPLYRVQCLPNWTMHYKCRYTLHLHFHASLARL
jgi:hypothetical protein